MTKILNFALKIKGGGREGGTCEVLRPCHPPKLWNVHLIVAFKVRDQHDKVPIPGKKAHQSKFVIFYQIETEL